MASPRKTVDVTCPHCGHVQPEPPSAYSSICKNCRGHFRIQEALHPAQKPSKVQVEHKLVRCFQCDAQIEVPKAATSSMCKKCSSHMDLADYRITQTVSKNFRTHGRLVIEEKGYLLNTDAFAGEAVVKGRLIGTLATVRSLEIHSGASINGIIKPGVLVVPAGHHLYWPVNIEAGGAEIAGELVATLTATGTVHLKSTARLFGEVRAANLVVEPGAVFVGAALIGDKGRLSQFAESTMAFRA